MSGTDLPSFPRRVYCSGDVELIVGANDLKKISQHLVARDNGGQGLTLRIETPIAAISLTSASMDTVYAELCRWGGSRAIGTKIDASVEGPDIQRVALKGRRAGQSVNITTVEIAPLGFN